MHLIGYRDKTIASDTITMPVIGPGGRDSPASITFAGPLHELTRNQYRRLREAEPFHARAGIRPLGLIEREDVLFVAERIVDWSGFKRRSDGQLVDIPFSREGAIKLLLDPRNDWLLTQCLDFLSRDRSPGPWQAPAGIGWLKGRAL